MAIELKGFRHVAVAVPIRAVGGLVSASTGQKSVQSQQADLAYHQTVIGWHGVTAGFGR
jgi:hypothetical protein